MLHTQAELFSHPFVWPTMATLPAPSLGFGAPFLADLGPSVLVPDTLLLVCVGPVFLTVRSVLGRQAFDFGCFREQCWLANKHPGVFVE